MCLPEQSARDAALAELARLDPTALDAASLMTQITDLATFISQAQGQLSRLTGTLDATGGAAEAGHKSASAFLRTRCGLAPGRAAAVVATARGLRELEATEKALNTGAISFDQAHIIVRATTDLGEAAGQAEEVLLDNAPGLDTARLRQFADEVAYRANPGAAEEREKRRWEKRHLSFGLTLDDTGMLSGACGDAVSYEILRTAAEAFAPPGGQLDTRTAAQRRMDGLVAACKAALDAGSAPERHGKAPHISVLVKDETLAQAPGAPPAQTGHGTLLTARQVLALCCGAQVGAIRWRDGLPLGVGRTARTEPPGLRRALGGPRPRLPLALLRRPRRLGDRPSHPPMERRRRHQPGRPGPVLSSASPLLHPPPGLADHRRPQRDPALHPSRWLAHPRQPPSRPLNRGPLTAAEEVPRRPGPSLPAA